MKRRKLSVRDLCECALAVALTYVCTLITVPVFAVPFTMQTFAVWFCVFYLGGARGLFTILIYLCIGALGVPVFSGMRGGIGVLLGPTGGYLIGFLFCALVFLAFGRHGATLAAKIAAALFGQLLLYAFGTAWFMAVNGTPIEPGAILSVLGVCVFPFLLPDAAKAALAILLAMKLKRINAKES